MDHIFAVEDGIFPFDRTDTLKQRYVDPTIFGITFVQYPVDLFGLPIGANPTLALQRLVTDAHAGFSWPTKISFKLRKELMSGTYGNPGPLSRGPK